MARTKKEDTKKTKKATKSDEEEIIDDVEEEPKKAKKAAPKRTTKKAATQETDVLSDVELDEEAEEGENDEIVEAKSRRPPVKKIDPESAIGELKVDEILSYLIQHATDTMNPELRNGCVGLLKRLKGGRRPRYGSKTNRGRGNFGGYQNDRNNQDSYGQQYQPQRNQNNFGPGPVNRNNGTRRFRNSQQQQQPDKDMYDA